MKLLLDNVKPDVLLLQETNLPNGINYNFPDYRIYRKDKKPNPIGGGVAILVNKNINSYLLGDSDTDGTSNIEYITVGINTTEKNTIAVTSVYCSPSKPITNDELSKLFVRKNNVICGDFNSRHLDYGSKTTNSRGNIMKDSVEGNDFTNVPLPAHTHTWTSRGEFGEDTIDYALTDCDIPINNIIPVTDIPSDHRGFLLELGASVTKNQEKRTIQLKRKIKWDEVNNDLDEKLSDILNDISIHKNETIDRFTIDKIAEKLSNTIRNTVDTHTPIATIKGHSPRIPPNLLKLIKDKRKLRRNYMLTRDIGIKSEINKLNKLIKKEFKKVSEAKTEHVIDSWERDGNRRNWREVKKLINCNRKGNTLGPIINNGVTIYKNEEMVDIFRTEMSNIFCKREEKYDDDSNPHFDHCIESLRKNRTFYSRKNKDFLVKTDELDKVITSLKNNKAPGHDNISNEILKNCKPVLLIPLTKLFNLCLTTGIFPSTWKLSIMTMLLKPNKAHSNPLSYRPLSLTPTIGKLFEKLITCRFNKWLEAKNILNNEQYGFRKNKNTYGCLFKLTQDIRTAFARKKNVQAVFLDIEKAFDKVWLEGLYRKLTYYGCPAYLKFIIMDFTMKRKVSIRVEDIFSLPFSPIHGVPQGNPLSPILFIFYVSDIPRPLKSIRLSQFADDIAIWRTEIKNEATSTQILNKYLHKLLIWCMKWHIGLNPIKTKAITFYKFMSGKPYHHEPIVLNNVPIEQVDEIKFLGITLDTNLTFEKHISLTIAKATPIFNEISLLSKFNLKEGNLIRLYKIFARSLLEYGAPILTCIDNKLAKKLTSFENKVIKMCLRIPLSSSSVEALVAAGIVTIKERILILGKKWYKIQSERNEDFKSFISNSEPLPNTPLVWLTEN